MNEPINIVGSITSDRYANKSCLLEFLIIAIVTGLAGILGAFGGILLLSSYLPPWQHSVIQSEIQEINDILFIDYHGRSSSNDVVFVEAGDGKYYSYHQGEWQRIEWKSIENEFSRSLQSTPCHEWYPKLITNPKNIVIDSEGVILEDSFADYFRCYVLFDDGCLHVWTRSINIVSGFGILGVSALIGAIFGFIVGAVVIRRLRLKTAVSTQTSTTSH